MNYRKTALVCGCSFTAGSYSWDPEYIQYNHVLQSDGTTVKQDNGLGRERLDINGGWVEHLDPQDHCDNISTIFKKNWKRRIFNKKSIIGSKAKERY